MNTTAIAVINGQQIQVSDDERQLVPIKPICQALGVDRKRQQDKIKEHPILSLVGGLTPLTGADGKTYEMFCLPLKYIYGWLFTINPNNVSDEASSHLIRYQSECYNALYEHFNRQAKRIAEENRAEIECLEKIAQLTQEVSSAKAQLNDEKKRLSVIRAGRLDNQPRLF